MLVELVEESLRNSTLISRASLYYVARVLSSYLSIHYFNKAFLSISCKLVTVSAKVNDMVPALSAFHKQLSSNVNRFYGWSRAQRQKKGHVHLRCSKTPQAGNP